MAHRGPAARPAKADLLRPPRGVDDLRALREVEMGLPLECLETNLVQAMVTTVAQWHNRRRIALPPKT